MRVSRALSQSDQLVGGQHQHAEHQMTHHLGGILAARHALYQQAKARQPARWSGKTHNWSHIEAVSLNPERDTVVRSVTQDDQQIQLKAA